jgi:hypothetical protein
MTSVVFDVGLGGDGSTVSDDANPTTGLKKGGYTTRFMLAMAQFVALCAGAKTNAASAQASATSALNAPGTSATCTTSIAIPTSFPTTVSFTLAQTGKLFNKGQSLVFADDTDPTKQFTGVLIAFVPSTGVGQLKAQQSAGTGTLASWDVSLSSPTDGTLTGRVSALETANAQALADRLFYDGSLI